MLRLLLSSSNTLLAAYEQAEQNRTLCCILVMVSDRNPQASLKLQQAESRKTEVLQKLLPKTCSPVKRTQATQGP